MFRIRDNVLEWVQKDSLSWCDFERTVHEMREQTAAGYWAIFNDDLGKTHILVDEDANDWRDVVNTMQ